MKLHSDPLLTLLSQTPSVILLQQPHFHLGLVPRISESPSVRFHLSLSFGLKVMSVSQVGEKLQSQNYSPKDTKHTRHDDPHLFSDV
jgi:hypothetical protein